MRHLALAAALLAAPLCAAAQTTGPAASPSQPGSVSPTTAPAKAGEYVAMAAAGDLYETSASQVVLHNAGSGEAVKRFAQEMVDDHGKASVQLLGAAQKAGVAVSAPALTQQQQAMVAQLRAAQGAQVDQIYLQQQAMAHQQALALHQGYAQRGDNEALRQVAQEASKLVQEHIDHLQKIRAGSR